MPPQAEAVVVLGPAAEAAAGPATVPHRGILMSTVTVAVAVAALGGGNKITKQQNRNSRKQHKTDWFILTMLPCSVDPASLTFPPHLSSLGIRPWKTQTKANHPATHWYHDPWAVQVQASVWLPLFVVVRLCVFLSPSLYLSVSLSLTLSHSTSTCSVRISDPITPTVPAHPRIPWKPPAILDKKLSSLSAL